MAGLDSDSAARQQRRRRLERFSRNEGIFPGGEHETGHCAGCARIIVGRFGGEVRGYWHEDNPTARVGEVEDGHDFAVTADRFLVDPWLHHYYGDSPVLDLTEPAGQAEALARYGPQEKWELLPGLQVTTGSANRAGRMRGLSR
jgi:hypothetical protein